MRTSNKILLGIFTGPLLILTLMHVALYAKYKSGHYTSMKKMEENQRVLVALKNIHTVSVYGLDNFTVRPSGNEHLELNKDDDAHFHYVVHGDSLIIHGDSTVSRSDNHPDIIRSHKQVVLYLGASADISVNNADIVLAGSKDSVLAGAYHIVLSASASFHVEENNHNGAGNIYFKALTIQASYAQGIELSYNARIGDLQLTAQASNFTDNGAGIDKLSINADRASSITLNGDNVKKLNTFH